MSKNKYDYEQFKAQWPDMFENVYCGFSLPPGWGPIVWRLCQNLERIHREENHSSTQEEEVPSLKVAQVKEKFGGLRFYVDGASEAQDKAINFTEAMSYCVCDQCGTTHDVTSEGGWITTFCQPCRKKQEQRRVRRNRWAKIKWHNPYRRYKRWKWRRQWEKKHNDG